MSSNVKTWWGRRVIATFAVAVAMLGAQLAIGHTTAFAYTTTYYSGAGPNVPRISVIGDSTLSGVRWTNNYGPLARFNYTFDAESCRRTVIPSCRGRESYAPQTGLETMRRLQGWLGDVLILMEGYNDPGSQFAEAVDAVVAEAKRQGVPHVIWLTMRTADVTYVSPVYKSTSYTFLDNNRILLQKAEQYGGYLQIADWATYSATQSSWVGSDGVHLTAAGAIAVTTYIAEMAAQVLAGYTITPQPPGVVPLPASNTPPRWRNVFQGERSQSVAAIQRALISMRYVLTGNADGLFDAETRAAVMAFQRGRGLLPTGVVDAATAQALGLAVPPWVDVSLGARGPIVLGIQWTLQREGVFVRGGADGVYGDSTRDAVALFQTRRGLPATGVVNAATAQALGLWSPTPFAAASATEMTVSEPLVSEPPTAASTTVVAPTVPAPTTTVAPATTTPVSPSTVPSTTVTPTTAAPTTEAPTTVPVTTVPVTTVPETTTTVDAAATTTVAP